MGQSQRTAAEKVVEKIMAKSLTSIVRNKLIDRTEVLQLMHQIPCCEEADETDVNEWVAADTKDHQVLTDTEIVSLIRQDFDEDSDVMDEADDSEPVSYTHLDVYKRQDTIVSTT